MENGTTETDLLALAAEADAGDVDSNAITSGQVADPAPETVTGTDADKTAEQPARSEESTQEPSPRKDGEEAAAGEGEDEAKPGDSQFVKAKKDEARLDKSWKTLNAEKEALRKEREAWEAEQKAAAENAQRSTLNAQRPTTEAAPKDAAGYSVSDYEAAAKEFDREGETELAEAARRKARELKDGEATGTAQRQQQELATTWNRCVEAECAKAENKDLLDGGSALSKEVQTLIQSEPYFSQVGDGFARAVQVARLRLEAGSVPGLKKQVEELQAKVEAANRKLSIGGSNPGRPAAEKAFGAMSTAEREKHLLAAAAELDAQGVPVLR